MEKTSEIEVESSSSFHRLMNIFDTAFRALGKTVEPLQVEALSCIVHHVMSQRGRRYHAMPHVFEIGQDASPIEQLAIVFHDTVYVQVDRRVHPKLKKFIKDFPIEAKTFHLVLPELTNVKTPDLVAIAYEIFSLKPNQTLTPALGENEFLSALAAARILDSFVNPWEIIQIMACIEATIPFRPLNVAGLSPADLLCQRLESINNKYHLGKTKEEIINVVRLSIKVSNRDLMGFSSHDPGHFLSQTWELLLEGNPIFRNPLYTTFQYRSALQKVEGFFSFLKPPVIFRQFQGEPNNTRYKALLSQAHFNLSIGIDYIQTKLMEMAVHEALSSLSGGGGPLVIFRGDIPNEKNYRQSLLDTYLDHNIPASPNASKNPVINRLLKAGRTAPDGFDFLHSTLGAYLYERLDEKDLIKIIQKSKELFSETISPLEFLELFPKPVLLSVLRATTQVAWSRKDAISELIKKFKILNRT
jgi:hypothetical protein